MQELLEAKRYKEVNVAFLKSLNDWFERKGMVLTHHDLYAEFFIRGTRTLKPGIRLRQQLLANNTEGLIVWLGVLIVDPAQVMLNCPEVVAAVRVVMQDDSPGSLSYYLPAQTQQPSNPDHPARTDNGIRRSMDGQYGSLVDAIHSEWGQSAVEISNNWPTRLHRKPTLEILATLARNPEQALTDDLNLLKAVYGMLGKNLPLGAYPPKLQAKLLRLHR